MEEQKKGKYDSEVRELKNNLSNILNDWMQKLELAQNTITTIQPSIDLLQSKSFTSPEISQFLSDFESTKTQLSTVQSEITPETLQSTLTEIEKLSNLIQISDSELSKTLKIVVNQDEKYKKEMEVQYLRQRLLTNEIDKAKDEIKENEEVVKAIQGEFERMRKMKVLKERDILEIKNRVADKEEELRNESENLGVMKKNFEEYEKSTDEVLPANINLVSSVQKKSEKEVNERWDMNSFVIPSFLLLILALIILI